MNEIDNRVREQGLTSSHKIDEGMILWVLLEEFQEAETKKF